MRERDSMRILKYIFVIPIILFASNQVLAQPIASTGKPVIHLNKVSTHVLKHVVKKHHHNTKPPIPKPNHPTQPTQSSQPTTPVKPPTNTNPPAPPTSSPPTTPDNGANISAVEKEVVTLVNAERTKRGLKPLAIDSKLCEIARLKSQDMITNKYFSHQSPTYGSPFDMMKKFGVSYRTAGENIAAGYSTAQAVFDGWMNSSGHRANILNPAYTKIGVGLAKGGNYGSYWTQEFTG